MPTMKWKEHQDALLRRRRGLLAPRYEERQPAIPDGEPDFLAWMSVIERRELADIYEALDRIDEGNYGLCRVCASPIDRVRLESIPWVRVRLLRGIGAGRSDSIPAHRRVRRRATASLSARRVTRR
jgi:hypothetical protein